MQSVTGLMQNYFAEPNKALLTENRGLPVEISKSDWLVMKDPERFSRTYTFEKKKEQLQFFVTELLEYQERLGHHAKITIEDGKVTVEVYTHGIERITDIDKEFAREADEIYKDSKAF